MGNVCSPQEPVGSGDYVVDEGECIDSIAFEHGFLWETIWNDVANLELRRVRHNPNELLPGDRVAIPAIRVRDVDCSTDRRHRFCRRGAVCMLRLHLLDESRPRAGLAYILEIDGTLISGSTDNEGAIEVRIPPDAREGKLTLTGGQVQEEYRLLLGHLDPPDSVTGAQGRLRNLGYDTGPVDGDFGPQTKGALRHFQEVHGLPATGTLDAATVRKLEEIFGG